MTSLSKISEEDSENIFKSDNHHFDVKMIEKVLDKDMFSDKVITSSTSDSPSGTERESQQKGGLGSGLVSRFLPEVLSRNKVTIV